MNSQPTDERRDQDRESSHTPAVFLVAHIGSCRLVVWSSSDQSRPPDIDTGKLASMSCKLRTAFLEPHEAIPPSSNPFWRGLVYRLWCPFLGGCRWSSRHFWECWVCLGYGLSHGPILNKVLCLSYALGGVLDKIQPGL